MFALIYVFAANLYPGGSQADLTHPGFDWVHNYWCNLTNLNAMNGQPNAARPYAVAGLWILCGGLGIFFFQFGNTVDFGKGWKRMVQISGILSVSLAALVFTRFHDLITILASIAGLFSLIGIVVGISKNKFRGFQWTGGMCVLLLLVNNVIYYAEAGIEWLPLIQKFTFLGVLLWVTGVSFKLIQIRKSVDCYNNQASSSFISAK